MFITFEGIEGSGKTTQIALLRVALQQKGYRCIVTREPGATAIGEKIRAILLDSANAAMFPLTELLLYEADRAQHVEEVIRPALDAGSVVLSDRFFDATVVYQGFARGLDLNLIQHIHRVLLGALVPDLTLVLDLPVEAGLKRAWDRIKGSAGGRAEDRFENEALSFHEKIRSGYLGLAKEDPGRFRVIDASADRDTVHREITEIVSGLQGQGEAR